MAQTTIRRSRRASSPAPADPTSFEESGSHDGLAAAPDLAPLEGTLVPSGAGVGASIKFPDPGLPPPPPPAHQGGPTPSYPILTEEVGYPPSPLANTGGTGTRSNGSSGGSAGGGRGGLGPTVTRALQDVLGWKIKSGDAAGFMGALNQSFTLKEVEGSVVSTWTPRSYAVQSDLSGGISGAQASIYTMAKTMLDQLLPLIDGLYPLDPASDAEDVAALKQLASSQLQNLTAEIGYLGGPRVMRVHQYFQMLLGVHLDLVLTPPPARLKLIKRQPPHNSPLAALFPAPKWPPAQAHDYWTNPDCVLGSLGNLRDELGLAELIGTTYVNTVSDEQNVTNFRVIVDYVNSVLNAWTNSIQFFAGATSRFLGTQLVIISRQLGVVSEAVDEVRFVLDSVFIGPAQRETTQIDFQSLTTAPAIIKDLPPIFLEDLLLWAQDFVGKEAQEVIQGGGKLGLGEDFSAIIQQLYTQTYGLYLFAQSQPTAALGTARVQQALYKLVNQLGELYGLAVPVELRYIAPRP
jgi:hypothetical protein